MAIDGATKPLEVVTYGRGGLDRSAEGHNVVERRTVQVSSELAMVPRGGRQYLPGGVLQLAQTLVLDRPMTLTGQGADVIGRRSPTILVPPPGAPAIRVTATGVNLAGFCVLGTNVEGSEGIHVRGSRCRIDDVNCEGHDGVGIRVGHSVAGTSANLWRLFNVMARDNGSHGILFDDAGGNANAGLCAGADVAGNGGDGLRTARCEVSTFTGVVAQANTGAGLRLASGAKSNTFLNPHAEANTLDQVLCDDGSVNNLLAGSMNFPPTDNGKNTVVRSAGGSNQQMVVIPALSVDGRMI